MPAPLAPVPSAKAFRFSAPRAQSFGVDRNLGIITGVSLITAGVEAKGHGIFIDAKTLTTAAAVLADKGNRFKAAISHLSWSDWWEGDSDRVMEFPGWFSGVTIRGDQLVADKLEFYDTFKSDQPRLFARILEMAEKTPDLFGISLEPWGYAVYVAEDGTEYSERPKDVPLKYDGIPAFRVTDLTYGAIVDDPAANPGGLFAQLSRRFGDTGLAAVLRALLAAKPATNFGPGVPSPQNTVHSQLTTAATPQQIPPMNELIKSIKAAFGADKAKFSRAMTILGEQPEITFEALKAAMHEQDVADLRTQLAALTTDKTNLTARVAQLETEKAALATERDTIRQNFEALKTSGHIAPEVPTGAPTGGVDLSADNPFLPGRENLTRQCEIAAQNPALAAQLRAAAKGATAPAPATKPTPA